MKVALRYREALSDTRRVVVKIGSRVLIQSTGRPDVRRMRALVDELAAMRRDGREVVLVTSGAIGAGMEALGMRQRPTRLPDLQMAAAVGQTRLMSRYDALFARKGCRVGQMLLTHGDFQQKMRLTNARRTMENLMRNAVIPIVNENDVVADEEIRADQVFGDNDYLAALVVKLIRADLLIVLTTTDGVRDTRPGMRGRRISFIEEVNKQTLALVTRSDSPLSKGGMDSKLRAAQTVARTGCAAIIANGRETGILTRLLNGEDRGTIVLAG
ncbi:MAG: glutamate 5-kinase [Verrucomicrobia bacterium]|nr:glutamate 5-kinase [Verrucomicrobiota bacterium]